MSISSNNLDKLKDVYKFNMVNHDNEKFNKLGLKPLYLKAKPLYINLEGNIFCYSTSHFECNLIEDIIRILSVMNSNVYDRFESSFLNDNFPVSFSIYNNQIFFSDASSLNIYKNYPTIRNEINKKMNLKDEFYEPTKEEIYNNYSYEYFEKWRIKYGNKREFYQFNLTPQEYFEMMIKSKNITLRPYTNADELNAYAMRDWLNVNANIFVERKCPRDTTGVYNEQTKDFVNSLLQTKLDIYNFFYRFSKQAIDWQKTVKELLSVLKVYTEFVPSERCNTFDLFGGDTSRYEEERYWESMFAKASRDMLVQFIGFDKIETQYSKTITTSKPNIYEEFFNLLIMEYNIVQIPRLVFDTESQHFRWIYPKEFINSGINREYENEIKLIKKYIPYEERYKFFKD